MGVIDWVGKAVDDYWRYTCGGKVNNIFKILLFEKKKK